MDFDIITNPEAHGHEECGHCNGYGSSLLEDGPTCSKCDGHGVVPVVEKEDNFNGNAMHLLDEL